MGILGLNNFLLRVCPEVVKDIPTRFRALEGGTIALDGTLITQRFHYGPIPHPFRHVLGWYRLVSEIRQSGMQAICVFDGNLRQVAKTRELAKRSGARKVVTSRAHHEIGRSHRLAELSFFVDQFRQLGNQARLQLTERFQDQFQRSQAHLSQQLLSLQTADHLPRLNLVTGTSAAIVGSHGSEPPQAKIHATSTKIVTDLSQATAAEKLVRMASSYKRDSSPEVAIPVGSQKATEDITLSKLQVELAQKEREIWDALFQELGIPADDPGSRLGDVSQHLRSLVESSEKLRLSYEKRMDPPRTQTYEECKSILAALGVPVLELDGEFEAEALASSLVLNKMADFVGSEDSDVLMHEVPLLRNVTNKGSPLSLIDGLEVRKALQLSKSAYIDFALLLGSDFSERITGLGPQTAIKLIRSLGSIELILQEERGKATGRRFSPEPKMSESEYLQDIAAGRKVFSSIPPISQSMKEHIFRGREQGNDQEVYDTLRAFDLGWSFREYETCEGTNFMGRDFYTSEHSEYLGLEGNYA